MKTWAVPVALVLLAMVGGLVIWVAEGTPGNSANSNPGYLSETSYPNDNVADQYRGAAPVITPASSSIPATGVPVVQPDLYSNSSDCEQQAMSMESVDPSSTIAPGIFAYLTGDSWLQSPNQASSSIDTCLWWHDNVPSPQKTYTLLRGPGGANPSIQSMTEIATLPGTYNAYLDALPNQPACYILQISDGPGKTYDTKDACFGED